MAVAIEMTSASCHPDEIPATFEQVLTTWSGNNPDRGLSAIEHQSCSIGTLTTPRVLLTFLITSNTRPRTEPLQ